MMDIINIHERKWNGRRGGRWEGQEIVTRMKIEDCRDELASNAPGLDEVLCEHGGQPLTWRRYLEMLVPGLESLLSIGPAPKEYPPYVHRPYRSRGSVVSPETLKGVEIYASGKTVAAAARGAEISHSRLYAYLAAHGLLRKKRK